MSGGDGLDEIPRQRRHQGRTYCDWLLPLELKARHLLHLKLPPDPILPHRNPRFMRSGAPVHYTRRALSYRRHYRHARFVSATPVLSLTTAPLTGARSAHCLAHYCPTTQ